MRNLLALRRREVATLRRLTIKTRQRRKRGHIAAKARKSLACGRQETKRRGITFASVELVEDLLED